MTRSASSSAKTMAKTISRSSRGHQASYARGQQCIPLQRRRNASPVRCTLRGRRSRQLQSAVCHALPRSACCAARTTPAASRACASRSSISARGAALSAARRHAVRRAAAAQPLHRGCPRRLERPCALCACHRRRPGAQRALPNASRHYFSRPIAWHQGRCPFVAPACVRLLQRCVDHSERCAAPVARYINRARFLLLCYMQSTALTTQMYVFSSSGFLSNSKTK